MKKIIALVILLLFLSIWDSHFINSSSEKELDNKWFLEPQIYDMVALPPDDVRDFHISVNGLWNGFFAANLSSPFAFGRYVESLFSGRTYNSDEDFVDAMHEEGLIVPATILTTQGHRSFQGDKLEEFACRSIDGKLCYWDRGADSYWMNALNDDFIDWCIEHGKKAIDAGADLIVLDEIQGSSFIPMYQWASQYLDWLDAPGFSNVTIQKFRNYLSSKYTEQQLQQMFDIDNISSYDLKSRLAETMYLQYEDRIKADRLNKEYFEFLEIGNFNAKKRLIHELRKYAEEKGKDIAIAANSYALGTPRGGGYWSKGLNFADLLDFFTFENKYSSLADENLPSPPRAKWLAWEKLAYASTHSPGVVLLGASEASYIAGDTAHLYRNYLSILCAEAYANRGAFVNWYVKIWGNPDNWKGCASIYDFVLKHEELYRGEIKSPVAILYLYGEGMRNKSDSYLGLAQMLAESNIPYEVIFDGDGFYINESLSINILTPYSLLFVPNVINITSRQKSILFNYVMQGATAVVFDAQALGFDMEEGEMKYGNGTFIFMRDIAHDYFHSYRDEDRKEVENVVNEKMKLPVIIKNANRRIVAYPYYLQDNKKIAIHIVNYDYNGRNDEITLKKNINILVKKPDFEVKSCYVISPDYEENVTLIPFQKGDYINITIPQLNTYDVVVLSEKEGKNILVDIVKPENALYIFDEEIMPSNKPIAIGKITVEADAYSANSLNEVEFYVDDALKYNDSAAPYSWLWNEFAIGSHEIKVVAYDSNGNSASDSINLWIFNV